MALQARKVTPEWEKPPREPRGYGKYSGFFHNLRGNPGEWARMPESMTTWGVATGRYAGCRPGEFETTLQQVDGERRGYIRFPEPKK